MRYLDLIPPLCDTLLRHYDPPEAEAVARHFVCECFAVPHHRLGEPLPSVRLPSAFETGKVRLQQGEPVQYVLGYAYYMGHRFRVGPGVLIPRPETEALTQYIAQQHSGSFSVLDIGTGSGCVALSLAHLGATAVGVDVSQEALAYARHNRQALGVQVRLYCRDALRATRLPAPLGGYDVLVSNPPYVLAHEFLPNHVRQYEPALALYSPQSNQSLWYHALAQHAQRHLNLGGKLYVEIAPQAAQLVQEICAQHKLHNIHTHQDFAEQERFVIASK